MLAFGHAAVYHGVLDFGTGTKLIALFLDLNSELSCGGKDKYDGPFARLEILLYGWQKRNQYERILAYMIKIGEKRSIKDRGSTRREEIWDRLGPFYHRTEFAKSLTISVGSLATLVVVVVGGQ